jgi:hypothetical protein
LRLHFNKEIGKRRQHTSDGIVIAGARKGLKIYQVRFYAASVLACY